MTMSDRGVHPDLIEEVQAEREAAEQPADETPPPRSRASTRSRRGSEPAPAVQESVEGAEGGVAPEAAETPTAPPDWLAQARAADDPVEAFKILSKNLPRDVLERDEVISGLVGSRADLRAKELLRQQERDALERQKREAAQSNDLYTLGELTQREINERAALEQQTASGSFMDGVVLFQSQLPEEIQRKVAGQTFGAGKGQAAGVAEYLQFISEERIKLKEAELEKEFRNRESALRKSVLTEVNGDEPVPERDGGTPGRVREVTDEQIEAMTVQEYDALFDEAGRPKPGVRHRSTRGIPLTQR